MMGERRVMQEALFYGFSLERHVPDNHLLRKIDRFVDLSEVRTHLEPYYSETGRPSIDPELMIRMLIVGYSFGIRSERRLCDEVHPNLAYRWFCRLGLDGDVPDHSTFSKNRHGRFRESDLLRKLFETVVARCMKEGVVGGEAFAVDASIIVADAHRRRGVAKVEDLIPTSSRAVAEYLSVLDDAAFSGATPVEPKVISPTDPAARYTASANSVAGYAYSDNYLIDLKHAVIVDVEATTTIRQAEGGAAKTMLDRTADQFDLTPSRLVADGGYGSADMVGWLVDERGIEPHLNLIDKSERTDGTFSREPTSHSIPNATSMSVPEVRSCENIAARSPCRARASQRTARSAIAPLNAIATPACSNPSAVQICPHARSRDPFMKPLVTRPVRSPKPRPTPSHVANEKRLRCSSLISNVYSGWVDCASVVQTEPKTSSS
jgi:transposase